MPLLQDMTLSNLSAAQLRRAVGLKEQIEELEAELVKILGSSGGNGVTRGGRNLSPEARERIAAAQRKRWAQYRKTNK
jgi:hypothetical protein